MDDRSHRRTTLTLLAASLPAAALLAAACSAGRATPDAPTAPAASARPSSAGAASATAARPGATPVPQDTPTPAPPRCPVPNLTPVAPTASPPPPGVTPAPTTAPRIAYPKTVPAPAPPLAPPPAPRDAPALAKALRDRIGDQAQHYAIVARDVRTGSGVSIAGGRVFYAASLFKLEVMYEIFHQREAGLLSFDETYIASDYYSQFDVGPNVIKPCGAVSIGNALLAMMSVSDNVAAVMLQDRAGARNINNAMDTLGLTSTRLTEDGSLPATADDLAQLLEAIARGDAVSPEASASMVDLMTTEQLADRIPARLPPDTRVAHKTGNWDNATHDAGIVFGTRGTYVIVVMSDLGFGSDAAATEADLARIAYDWFETGANP